ncbi:diguanylate cyclase domain-containing protein [Roseibium sp.]|uniref:diguanylate cyclase domain-containing protein n=1 Tax=Roseibium sp. TaxID=1936156 RepID=UPI003A96A2D0
MSFRQIMQGTISRRASVGISLAAAGVVLFASLLLTAHVSGLVADGAKGRQEQQVLAELSKIRARLEGRLLETAALGDGLKSYVSRHVDLSEDDFEFLGANLLDANKNLRSIGLAHGNVLQHIYPLEGNEAAIGVDYRKVPGQWPDIERAMLERKTIVSGPVDLVQGGRALLVRVPIFSPRYSGQPIPEWAYWGVATLVLDEARVFASAGLINSYDDFSVGLTFADAALQPGAHIFGRRFDGSTDALSLPVDVPGADGWVLNARPKVTGLGGYNREVWLNGLVGVGISLMRAGVVFLVLYQLFRVRSLALHDALTGLPNRRLLDQRMEQLVTQEERGGGGFEIVFVDLDGFKPINDTYGHGIGDLLLSEVGRRLCKFAKPGDTVARIGGDEFIIMVSETMPEDARKAYCTSLDAYLDDVIEVSGISLVVRASVGHASYPDDAETISELRRVADTRMYMEKTRKRDLATPDRKTRTLGIAV